jgi:amino acid transporter
MAQLRRVLGIRDLVLFNVIAVIGIRWLAAAAHVGPSAITLWLIAAVLFFIPSAFAVATLSRHLPEEGGIYVWTRDSFGEWHAFLCGWCYWLSNLFYFPNLVISGMSIAAATMRFREDTSHIIAVSVAVVWIALLPNIFGLQIGKWIGNAGAAATYFAGMLLIALGAMAAWNRGSATPLDLMPHWDFGKLNFWSQIAFAFGGLELGAILAGEIRDPKRTVPRATWISGVAIAGFYILGTLALLVLVTPDRISVLTGLVQAGDVASSRLGITWIAPVLGILVSFSVVGQMGTWAAGSARVPFVIGIDHYLPQAFAKLHPKWGTPHVSILVQGVVSTAFLLVLAAGENLRTAYQLLVDMTVITYFIPFAYLFASAWKFGSRWSVLAGLFTTVAAVLLSLVPPSDTASWWIFELKLLVGTFLLVATARLWFSRAVRHRT